MRRIIAFVFIVLFPLVAAGQTARRLIEQDPHRALGNMCPYQRLDSVYTDAPKGYKLFYVSHLGRHGSRFSSRMPERAATHKRYGDFAAKGMLTDEGKRFLDDLIAIEAVASRNYGALSTLGQRELTGIGERMFRNAGTLFRGDAKVETYATSSTRVMRSRDCLVSGLKKYNPDLNVTYAVSNRTGRTEQEVRGYYISEDEIQESKNRNDLRPLYRKIWKKSELDAFRKRIFRTVPDSLDIRSAIYSFYGSGQACIACDSNLPDITRRLTTDELYNAWLRNNLSWYGNSCLWDGGIHTRNYRMGGGIVQCIMDDADAVIAGKKDVSATLRFSHDTYLLPVISFMNLHGVNFPTLQEAAEGFLNWENVCLGTNVQLFFYRNRAGKVLVKILKNEKETTVDSIKPAAKGVYYRWDDLKNFWNSRMKLTANDRKIVGVGGLSEAKYGVSTAKLIRNEGIADMTVLFLSPWHPDTLRALASYCRANGLRFTMDEIMDRRNKGPKKIYRDNADEIVRALKDNADVVDGSLMMSEFGGVQFFWPTATVANSDRIIPPVNTYAEADEFIQKRLKEAMADADSLGIPRPFISIEPSALTIPHILRAGMDRVDVEMIYGRESERRYAAASGATKAYGKETFGVDDASVWYAGEQRDELWFNRWKISLYHAFIRGADPIYVEHGLMNYSAFGTRNDVNHPLVKRLRRILGSFRSWATRNPRPVGLPRAAVAVLQGRHDGYVGEFQTHLWGQRTQDKFRVGAPDDAWKILDRFYRRDAWEETDKYGKTDFSGNPPLGAVDILPYDAPDEAYARYNTIILLGRNVMDDALYRRLVTYVRQGGRLLLAASHLDTADAPDLPFTPYNGGDWSELTGLKAVPGSSDRMEYGLKFVSDAPCGWHFHLKGPVCDPWFTDGGFDMPVFENVSAQTLAVASKAFPDKALDGKPVLFANNVGSGTVVFVPSIDSPGERGVMNLYEYIARSALDAVDVWPKVECSDRVRWSVYEDGTIYLLNTEDHLSQTVVVYDSEEAKPRRLHLGPGEIRVLKPVKN